MRLQGTGSIIFLLHSTIHRPLAHQGWIGPIGPPRKIGKILAFFGFFRPTQKIGWEGPKWGREVIFPANPDLANISGRTDFDFENFIFFDLLGPKFLAWAQLGSTHLGPAWAHPLGFPDAAAGAGAAQRTQG